MKPIRDMRYRILIVSYSMGIGGVERALLGLLRNIDYSTCNVTLKLANKRGELLSNIPMQVKVSEIVSIKKNWTLFNKPLLPQIRRLFCRNLLMGLMLLADFVKYKITGHYHSLFRHTLEKDREEYDLAISYAGPSSLLDYYVAHCVNARKKVIWIHFDVDRCGINRNSERFLYRKFDKIFIVSDEGKRKFDRMFPKESGKSAVFHNIIDTQEIKRLSEVYLPDLKQDCINIVTVGRISKEKGQDLAVKALSVLVNNGYNVNWILVGAGNYEIEVKKIAEYLNVSHLINITGAKANPYPYMKGCDIYVQPSKHEGFCITLAEAKLFGMPIVVTDFTGAREQLANYSNSFIANHNADCIAKYIEQIINKKLFKEKHPSETGVSDFYKFESSLFG